MRADQVQRPGYPVRLDLEAGDGMPVGRPLLVPLPDHPQPSRLPDEQGQVTAMMDAGDQETLHPQDPLGQVEDAVILVPPAPALTFLERPAVGPPASQEDELAEQPLVAAVIEPAVEQ